MNTPQKVTLKISSVITVPWIAYWLGILYYGLAHGAVRQLDIYIIIGALFGGLIISATPTIIIYRMWTDKKPFDPAQGE